jgi:hypothetical protein
MDQLSEVEIKLDATGLDPRAFMAFVVSQDVHLERVKIIQGKDTFYRKENDVVRYRCDGQERISFLTVKKRKSASSILDRIEVDVPLKEGTPPETVEAFFEVSGWTKEFSINKDYHFFNVDGVSDSGAHYKACIAMYDVWGKSSSNKKRFLEVEIERESDCSSYEAVKILNEWLVNIKKSLLPDAKPLNLSLYEFYSKEQ